MAPETDRHGAITVWGNLGLDYARHVFLKIARPHLSGSLGELESILSCKILSQLAMPFSEYGS